MNAKLQSAFQFHMRAAIQTRENTQHQTPKAKVTSPFGAARLAIVKARADVRENRTRYPDPINGFGHYWKQAKPGMYYVRDFAHQFRNAGFADEINRSIQHTGWFNDEFQDEMTRGIVGQLPAKDRQPTFIAGYQTTNDESNDGGATFDFSELFGDSKEAAYRADQLAERAAEREREYQEAWHSGARYASLAEEIADDRATLRKLASERRTARKVLPADQFPTLCATILAKAESILESIETAKAAREELWSTFEPMQRPRNYPNDSQRLSMWNAFREGAQL